MDSSRKTIPYHNKKRLFPLFDFKLNTVKKTIRIALLLVFAMALVTEVQAQQHRKIIYLQNYDKAPYHFGFLIGANFMDYNLMLKENYQNEIYTNFQDLPTATGNAQSNIPISESYFVSYQITKVERDTMGWALNNIPRVGFSVGVIGDLRITDNMNLRLSPTFSLSEINYRYTVQVNQSRVTADNDTVYYSQVFSRRSHNPYLSCVEFPLHLKYRSKRYNNIAAYLIAGANPKLYFSFKKQNEDFNWLKPNAFDIALEAGTGFDIYNQWFKMGVEFKFSFGLLDAMSESQVFYYGKPLNGFKNKQFQLSFTFE